jgi:hypothetical protein
VVGELVWGFPLWRGSAWGGWTARTRLLQELRGRVRPKELRADERGKAGALGMERDKLRGRGLGCLNPLWCGRNARKGKQRARSVAQRWRRMGKLSSSLALRIRLGRQVHSGRAGKAQWAATGAWRAGSRRWALSRNRRTGR